MILYESYYYGITALGDHVAHSGVKGQKWYQRRWQNYDGSLTPAGRIHYGIGEGRRGGGERLEQYKGNFERATKKLNAKIHANTKLKQKVVSTVRTRDIQSVNPHYSPYNPGTTMNCMCCTATYEMRRRGYDVTATLSTSGWPFEDMYKRWFPNAKRTNVLDPAIKFRDKSPHDWTDDDIQSYYNNMQEAYKGNNIKAAKKTIADIESQGDGARGALLLAWDQGDGHAMNYEVIKGKMYLIDCQSGKYTYDKPSLENYMRYCSYIDHVRLDNADFDPVRIKEATRNARKKDIPRSNGNRSKEVSK